MHSSRKTEEPCGVLSRPPAPPLPGAVAVAVGRQCPVLPPRAGGPQAHTDPLLNLLPLSLTCPVSPDQLAQRPTSVLPPLGGWHCFGEAATSGERFKVITWPCPPEQGTEDEASGRQTQTHGRQRQRRSLCGNEGWDSGRGQ